jgi:hypothetical protein
VRVWAGTPCLLIDCDDHLVLPCDQCPGAGAAAALQYVAGATGPVIKSLTLASPFVVLGGRDGLAQAYAGEKVGEGWGT